MPMDSVPTTTKSLDNNTCTLRQYSSFTSFMYAFFVEIETGLDFTIHSTNPVLVQCNWVSSIFLCEKLGIVSLDCISSSSSSCILLHSISFLWFKTKTRFVFCLFFSWQSTVDANAGDKFGSFLQTSLNALSLLLEVSSSSDILKVCFLLLCHILV